MNSSHIADEILVAYAAKELNEADSTIVCDHAALCPECNLTVTWFKTIRGLMRGDYGQDPSLTSLSRAYAIFREHKLAPKSIRTLPNFESIFKFLSQYVVVPAIAVVALLFIFWTSQTLILSARDNLPGDYLYPVRLNVERLQLAFTLSKDDQVNFLIGIAQNRATEITLLKDKGRYDYIPNTSLSYEDAIDRATRTVDDLAATDPASAAILCAEIDLVVKNNVAELSSDLTQVPPQAQTAIQRAIADSGENVSNEVKKLQSNPPKIKASPTSVPTNAPTAPKLGRQATPQAQPIATEYIKPTAEPTGKPKPTNKLNSNDKATLTAMPSPTDKPKAPKTNATLDKPKANVKP